MEKIAIVGGGVIGTMHALLAVEAGYQVAHIEKDPTPLSASVRNFGLIWVSGRKAGAELELALRARTLWEEISKTADIGFRANGSLTIAANEQEMSVMQKAADLEDFDARGFNILDPVEIKNFEPGLKIGRAHV